MKNPNHSRASRGIQRGLIGLLVVAGFCLLCPPALAQQPDLTVEIVTQQIELPPHRPTQIQVALRNTGPHPLEDIQLSWFTDLPVVLVETEPVAGALRPAEALIWTATLSSTAQQPLSGPVHIRVDYRRPSEDGSGTITGVAYGALQVASPTPPSLASLVQVEVQSAIDTLNEKRPIVLYLILNNLSARPISVLQAVPTGPPFVEFEPGRLANEQIIAPGQSHSLSFTVTPQGALVPGDHLLLFDVTLAWEQDDQTHQRSLILPKTVTIESFGESEVLKVLGVPSFYILPGFLMVVTVGLLWRLSHSGHEFPFKATNPEFWLVAITLSILMALAYPRVTQRDYLAGYNLADVVQIWLASIVLAAGSFILVIGGRNLAGRALQLAHAIRQQHRTPSEKDEPVALLRKLHRQDLGVYLERVELQVDAQNDFAFVLQQKEGEWETLWVGPAIVVEWLQGADVALRQQVSEQLGDNGSAVKLAELLALGKKQGDLRVHWKQSGPLSRPYLVRREDVVSFEPANVLIEEE